MTIWFVSRHAGAIAWAKGQNLPVDRWVSHLDARQVTAGDTVIGTLPVHIAADICSRGARFFLKRIVPSGNILSGLRPGTEIYVFVLEN